MDLSGAFSSVAECITLVKRAIRLEFEKGVRSACVFNVRPEKVSMLVSTEKTELMLRATP